MTPMTKGTRRKKGWGLLSSHGRVLVYVAVNPGSTREEIARGLQITERSAWGIIRDLQTTDAIRPRRDNGSLYYTVNLSAPLWEPVLSGHTVRSIVRDFARGGRSPGHDARTSRKESG